MEFEGILGEMIGMMSVVGGLSVGAYAIYVGFRERQLRMENISKERLLLIEKGMDPALAYQKPGKDKDRGSRPLLWGLLTAGLGLGLLVGNAVAHKLGFEYEQITLACALLFGGIGMVIYYVYNNKRIAQKAG